MTYALHGVNAPNDFTRQVETLKGQRTTSITVKLAFHSCLYVAQTSRDATFSQSISNSVFLCEVGSDGCSLSYLATFGPPLCRRARRHAYTRLIAFQLMQHNARITNFCLSLGPAQLQETGIAQSTDNVKATPDVDAA